MSRHAGVVLTLFLVIIFIRLFESQRLGNAIHSIFYPSLGGTTQVQQPSPKIVDTYVGPGEVKSAP